MVDTRVPTKTELRRWRRYLADERAEAAVYRDLAARREGGEERDILLALAEAEGRHEQHWRALLGDRVGRPAGTDLRTRILGLLARRFGSIFVLALVQSAEARSPYEDDVDATDAMAADERIHGEVVRGLAARGRTQLSGTFRAAVFGANDGLVSNLALVLGISASGVSNSVVLLTGLSGLLAGALSMGAGEFVSVTSQRELLNASAPDPDAQDALPHLDVDANELALVYRARGMDPEEATDHAHAVLSTLQVRTTPVAVPAMIAPPTPGQVGAGVVPAVAASGAADSSPKDAAPSDHEELGSGIGAAVSSFCFFASGAIIPVLPFLIGFQGLVAIVIAAVLVGLALLGTGAVVGLLSGTSPLRRALRQLAIGYGAAAVTYGLGLLFGVESH